MTIKSFNARHGITVGANTIAIVDANGNITANTILVGGSALNSTAFAGTANNASFLNGQPAAYYTNASNLSTGTINVLRLPTSGVTANVYGNSSSIPVVTVDTYGRVTSVTTSAVAGVTSFAYTAANSTFSIGTGAGSTYTATITAANSTVAGIVTVLDSTTNTSITIAASANTVKNAFDRAIDANTRAASAQTAAISAYSNAVSYTDSAIAAANVSGAAAIAYTNATSFASNVAATAYSNAVSTAASDATSKAATAYSNAVSTAAADATSKANNAYTTAVSTASTDATNKAANAYSNAVSTAASDATSKANNAYTTAVSAAASDATSKANNAYTTAVAAAASDASSKASTAYTNATGFAANASNISSGTLAEARLPYRMNQNVRTTDTVEFGNMTVTGNLTVTGTTVTVNANNLVVQDNMIYLNDGNVVTNPDLGIAGNYNDGTYRHAGFFRDASDGVWKVYDQYLPEPDATPYIDTSNASFRVADFQANVVTMASANVGGAIINSTSYSGAANNASYLGTYAASAYPRKSEGAAIDGAWNFSNTGIIWSGHSYTNTLDGSNVYLHIGQATSTDKVWNLRVYKADNSVTTFIFNSAGVATAENSYRAPLFYDINNTSYYVDPASTSYLNNSTFVGTVGIGTSSPGAKLETYQNIGGTNAIRMNTNFAGGNYVDLNPSITGVSNGGYSISLNGNIYQVISVDGNTGVGTTSPATKLHVGGGSLRIEHPGDRALDFIRSGASTFTIEHDTSRMYFYNASTANNIMSFSNASNVGIGVADADYKLDVRGIISSTVDVRAPIFYDSNNTGFYVDPNGTSRMGSINADGLTVNSRINGGINGDARLLYSDTGTNGGGLQYWNILNNTTLNPTDNWWYGIRMAHGDADTYYNATLAVSFFSDDLYLRRKTGGTDQTWRRFWHNGDSTISASGDFRAPIFYDSDNTNYYLDPANTGTSLTVAGKVGIGTTNPSSLLEMYSSSVARLAVVSDLNATISIGRYVTSAAGSSLQFAKYRGSYASPAAVASGDILGSIVSFGYGGTNVRALATITSAVDTFTSDSNISSYMSFATSTAGSAVSTEKMRINSSGTVSATGDFRAPIFYDSNNTAYYLDPASTTYINQLQILGGNPVYPAQWTTGYQSSSDFADGTLVTTDIPATASAGDSFIIEIVGKSYSATNLPFKVIAQGYLYNDTIINYTGASYTGTFSSYIKAFQDGGVLKFWWPRISYWNSFEVRVISMDGPTNNTITRNRVTSITNATEPTGTKKVQINLGTFMRADVTATNAEDLRAPIFYDSNNTVYYIDGAGTSVLNVLRPNTLQFSSGNQAADLTNGSYFILRDPTANPAIYLGGADPANYYDNTNHYFRTRAGSTVATINGNGMYAPVFYDSNDTNYYVDSSSNSVLNTLYFRNSAGSNIKAIYANYFGYSTSYRTLVIGNEAYQTVCIGVDPIGNLSGSFNGGGSGVEVMFKNGVNFITPNSSNNGYHTPLTLADGYAASGGSLRAPIFYDQSDTGYYVDPNGTSRLSTVQMGNVLNLNGWQESVATSSFRGIEFHSVDNRDYYIGKPAGAWTQPLHVHFYTGIWYRAHSSYGGHRFYNLNDGGLKFSVADGDNNVRAYSAFYAPIMYDIDNTAYYADPATTSNLVGVQVNGTLNVLNSNAQFWGSVNGAYQRVDSRNEASIYARAHWYGVRNDGATSNFRHSWYDGSAYFDITADSGTLSFARGGGAIITSNGSWRAPIFYDTDNTGYYLDPASTDSMNLRGYAYFGDYGAGVVGSYDSYRYQLVFAMGSAYKGAINGTSVSGGYGLWWSHPNAGGVASNLSSHGLMCIVNGQFFASLDASTRAITDMRSPIFYDLNNTGFYCDPNSYSSFYGVAIRGDQNATAAGNQLFLWDAGGTTTSAIGFKQVGGAWAEYGSTTGGYNTYFTMDTAGRGWVFRRSTNPGGDFSGTNVASITNTGIATFSDSVRTPIFYDSNDTGYYVNPNGASQMSSVYANDWFRPQGQSGLYFQDYGGGWHMTDTTWIRAYNGKAVYVSNEIAATGNITAYYSDERLKTRVGNINDALDRVLRLDGFYYTENETARELGYNSDRQQVGVSAQQIQEVLPEAVYMAPVDIAVDEDGNKYSKTGENYLTVDYSRLVPLLIEAIKEQQLTITEQSAKINTLEAKLDLIIQKLEG